MGRFRGELRVVGGGIEVDGRPLRFFSEPEPTSLPWADLGVDVVIEATGRFRDRAAVAAHVDAGAPFVVVSAPDGSVTDLVARLGLEVTAAEANEAFRAAATAGPLVGVLSYSEEAIVSSDIVGSPASCIFDAPLTLAIGNMVKVLGWYDNEWGYANRLVDLARIVGAANQQ